VSSVKVIHRRISGYCITPFTVTNRVTLNIKCEVLNEYYEHKYPYQKIRIFNARIFLCLKETGLPFSDLLDNLY